MVNQSLRPQVVWIVTWCIIGLSIVFCNTIYLFRHIKSIFSYYFDIYRHIFEQCICLRKDSEITQRDLRVAKWPTRKYFQWQFQVMQIIQTLWKLSQLKMTFRTSSKSAQKHLWVTEHNVLEQHIVFCLLWRAFVNHSSAIFLRCTFN